MIRKFRNKPRHKNIWRGKTITLLGLGVLGGGVEDAIFFIKNGANLIITDLKDTKELSESIKKLKRYEKNIKYVLGQHNEEDFIRTDLVIKNPGVPNNLKYLQIAKSNEVPIDTSIGIFFELMNTKKLIGITGTKGKSTIATLLLDILKTKYPKTYITGTPGTSPLSFVGNKNWGILELSSWRLQGVNQHKKSPHIALITNIEQDHLNMHKSFAEYVEAKKIIFKYQTKDDYLVVNQKLRNVTKKASSKIQFFSNQISKELSNLDIYPENINAALKVADILGINKKETIGTIKNFKGLPGRLELVDTINGIEIYNDTTATNPFATFRALEKFKDKKIALIAGGKDKNLEYSKLSKKISGLHYVALLPGSASDKMYNNGTERVQGLEEALEKCLTKNPDVVLLSPAAASFNMFSNEFDRGEKFNEIVKNFLQK